MHLINISMLTLTFTCAFFFLCVCGNYQSIYCTLDLLRTSSTAPRGVPRGHCLTRNKASQPLRIFKLLRTRFQFKIIIIIIVMNIPMIFIALHSRPTPLYISSSMLYMQLDSSTFSLPHTWLPSNSSSGFPYSFLQYY